MKNFNLNKEKMYVLILSGFLLINTSSCGKATVKQENNDYHVEDKMEEKDIQEVQNSSSFTTGEPAVDKKEDMSLEEIQNNIVVYSEEDNVIIEEFTTIKNKLIDYVNSEEVESAKKMAKGVFVSIVDFLFYDGELKGIKFDDLTEEGQKKVLSLATEVDSCMMKKFPTYKEDISSATKNAYAKASELIEKGSNNIKEFSKEKLGEDNYNAIKDAKDELVEYTKEAAVVVGDLSSKLWNSTKEKIKNWYEGFREN